MKRERLQLALERLHPEQWKMFEEFASAFLSSQYPNIRTVASPYGDRGRDAELFSHDGRIKTIFQYSITRDWASKIRTTARTVSESFSDAKILIYVTNQSILSAADSLKNELLEKYELILDIHDISWFLDRLGGDEHRNAVSEELARKIVDPYLDSTNVLKRSAPALSTTEYQAALTFLQLQWEDDTREKGLTKLSFQALVRAVLRKTHSESRMSRSEIKNRIMEIFPNHDTKHVQNLVDSALQKLTKSYIRHWSKQDEFCLTHAEAERVRERLAKIEVANSDLDFEIQSVLNRYLNQNTEEVDLLSNLCRIAIDRYLFERGETFAAAITNNKLHKIGVKELEKSIGHVARSELEKSSPKQKEQIVQTIYEAMVDLFTEPSTTIQNHLHSKANAYTLFAFLGRTPDIQGAISKMFSHGTIWLDTSIILPLFAETLIFDEQRRFTQMLEVASSAGLELRVTSGVIEEIERHLNRCLTYVRTPHFQWIGHVPFLIDAYMRSGQPPASFPFWIETFEGPERPEDDLAEYLREFFNIEHEDLEEEEMKAEPTIRATVQEAWRAAHASRRRRPDNSLDDITMDRLVRHDVENYLGVMERRRQDRPSSLGYSAWWLTLDRLADQVDKDIRETLKDQTPPTPIMSADFLVNYLSIGPMRSKLTREVESTLPITLLDVGMFDELPPDLLLEAERIRQESADLPDHMIRRRVRDHLDAAKRRPGHIKREGIQSVLKAISSETSRD